MDTALILVACMVLLVVLLGLPLLFRPTSRIPDYLGLALLCAALLYFAWSLEAWWVLLPAAVIVIFAVWLDNRGSAAASHYDARGWSGRTRLRMRLWVSANLFGWMLIAGAAIVFATGSHLVPFELIVEGLLLSMLASYLFRFSFYNAAERDRDTHAGAATDRPDLDRKHASPAALG